MLKSLRSPRSIRTPKFLKIFEASSTETYTKSHAPKRRPTAVRTILLSLMIATGLSWSMTGCKNDHKTGEPTSKTTGLFNGEILSLLSEDAALVGRMLASSAPGQKFLLTRSSKGDSISSNPPGNAGSVPLVAGPIGESLKLGELNEIVQAVDDQGKLKDDLADLAFALVPKIVDKKDPAKISANSENASNNPLTVEVVARFKDDSAKSRVEKIAKALQQKGRAIKQLGLVGCDSSMSFVQQVELNNPSEQLSAQTEIPNELKSDLKGEFEISLGSKGGTLFAATEGSWVKDHCANQGASVQDNPPKLLKAGASQELINSVPDGGSAFSFMLAAPEPLLLAVAKSSKEGASSEQLQQFSTHLPEAVLFTQQMPDSLISRVNLSISKLPKELHAGLNGDVNPLLKHVSNSSILSLSLSGDLLRAAASIPQRSGQPGDQKQDSTYKKAQNQRPGDKKSKTISDSNSETSLISEQLAPYLNNNKGLSLSITSIAAGKMFPGVAIIINDPDAGKLKERFKQELPSLLGDSASMLPPFQTKQSGSLEIDYSLTPFGVGLFLASKDDLLIVASEEELLASLGATKEVSVDGGQPGGSILASLEPTFSKELRELKNSVFFNLDFNRLAAAISSAENTASMFTGGKGLVSPEQLRAIKEMGKVSGRITLANGILSLVQSNSYPSQTP